DGAGLSGRLSGPHYGHGPQLTSTLIRSSTSTTLEQSVSPLHGFGEPQVPQCRMIAIRSSTSIRPSPADGGATSAGHGAAMNVSVTGSLVYATTGSTQFGPL